MAEIQTKANDASVDEFLASIELPRRRDDGIELRKIMETVTGVEAVMWGPAIVGFGSYSYRYANGELGEGPKVGFSPRKQYLALYGLVEAPSADGLLARLGPHRRTVACVYVTALAKIDGAVLRELIEAGFAAEV